MKILQILVLIAGLSFFINGQTTSKATLTGTVYDPTGAVIPMMKITAINERGEKFETQTNADGVYVLNLTFNLYDSKPAANFRIAKYEIIVEKARGFDKFIVKDFKFVAVYTGKMIFDFALDIDNSNCGAGGCIPEMSQLIELQNLKISDKILQKPLEKLPKKQENQKGKINK